MGRARREGSWVLLAEDDEDLRRVLSDCIEEDGCAVTGVSSGGELLDTLRDALNTKVAPALVITDERMPGASGSAVLERARLLGCAQPLVLMTAHWDRDLVSRARQVGAAVMTKPVQVADLLGLVRWSLNLQGADPDPPSLQCAACLTGQNVRPADDESGVMFCRDCRDLTESIDPQELGVGD